MENNEKQNEGGKEICVPPDLPELDFPIAPDNSLSNVSSILNIADTMYLSNFEALLSDGMLCASESDHSITKSNDKTIVECQDSDTATTSSGKKNIISSSDGIFLTEDERIEDLEAKTRSGDANTIALRMQTRNLNYYERSEDDGDFSATDGSDYVSNSDEKPRKFKKIITKKKAKVNLMGRISQALSDTHMDKASTSKALVIVPETPNSSFQTSNANVLVPETPESSFEKGDTLKQKQPNNICNNQTKNDFSSLQLNKETSRLSDEPTDFAAQISQTVSSDSLDLDGRISVQNQVATKDIDIPSPLEQTTTGKRSWNRRNCCFYCENLVTNFTRHLIRNHQEEPEVLRLMAITDSDPKIQKRKRQAITDDLRNRGNYIHNSKVVSNNEGHLITARRTNDEPNKPQSPSTYVVCKNCLGTFKRSTFYRHSKKCGGTDAESKHSLARNAISIIPNLKNASKELINNILPRLRNDDISLIAKNDPLIISYGCRLLKKKKERRSRKSICSKMRDLAHLLKILKEKNPDINQLQQLFDPKYYECLIEAVKKMSGFNEETGYVEVVSVPARLRPEILGCIEILFTNTIMDSGKSSALKDLIKNKLSEFKLLLEANWQWEISSNAEKTRKQKLMTKPQVMPVDEDIEKLITKIHDLEETYYKNLKKDVTVVNYENLCEVTIAHIILLDRKRSGDVAESELQYYLNRNIDEIPLQVLETLDNKQKQAISELDIFQIPGKRGRPVPVLLTKIMKRNIDILIASRSVLKISSNNKYLFARPLTEEPFDGGKCLNRIKSMCLLRKPEMLTSTGLRHHIATISQVHAKTDEKYTQHLATFLGHDMQVHSSNYRLPIQAIQKGVIGSRLLEVEQLSKKQRDLLPKQNEDNQDNYYNNGTKIESDKENSIEGENITEKNYKQNLRKEGKKKSITTNEEPDEHVDKNDKQKRKKVKKFLTTDEESNEQVDTIGKQNQRKKVHKNTTTDEELDEQVDKIGKQNRRKKVHKNTTTDEESDEQVDKIGKQNRRKKVHKNTTTDEESDELVNKIGKQNRRKKLHKNTTTDEESDELVDKVKRRKKIHKKWSQDEIDAVMRHLRKFIVMKKNPGKAICEQVLRKEPVLHNRTWMHVNTYINNIYKKKP